MSYQQAIEAAGCDVIEFKEFGSYQGEWLALVIHDGEVGIIEGSYGSCPGCDAFEAEFGWEDPGAEKLKEFGETYLPALPISHYITQFEKRVSDWEWDSEAKEMLDVIIGWSKNY